MFANSHRQRQRGYNKILYELHTHIYCTTSPICPNAPTGAIDLNFGMSGDIASVLTHAKFCVDHFSGFGVLSPQFYS